MSGIASLALSLILVFSGLVGAGAVGYKAGYRLGEVQRADAALPVAAPAAFAALLAAYGISVGAYASSHGMQNAEAASQLWNSFSTAAANNAAVENWFDGAATLQKLVVDDIPNAVLDATSNWVVNDNVAATTQESMGTSQNPTTGDVVKTATWSQLITAPSSCYLHNSSGICALSNPSYFYSTSSSVVWFAGVSFSNVVHSGSSVGFDYSGGAGGFVATSNSGTTSVVNTGSVTGSGSGFPLKAKSSHFSNVGGHSGEGYSGNWQAVGQNWSRTVSTVNAIYSTSLAAALGFLVSTEPGTVVKPNTGVLYPDVPAELTDSYAQPSELTETVRSLNQGKEVDVSGANTAAADVPWGDIVKPIQSVVTAGWGWLQSVWGDVANVGQNVVNGIEEGVRTLSQNIGQGIEQGVKILNDTLSGVQSGIESGVKDLQKSLSGVLDGIEAGVKDLSKSLSDVGSQVIEGIQTGVNSLSKTLQGVIDAIRGAVQDISNAISKAWTENLAKIRGWLKTNVLPLVQPIIDWFNPPAVPEGENPFSPLRGIALNRVFPFCLVDDAKSFSDKLTSVSSSSKWAFEVPLSNFNSKQIGHVFDDLKFDITDVQGLAPYVSGVFKLLWVAVLLVWGRRLFLHEGSGGSE